MKSIPACLARLGFLDLSGARGRPTALARLVFVILLLHARGDPPIAWPGRSRLADLTGADPAAVRKALALLRDRGVIERVRNPFPNVRRAWRILLIDTGDDECTRVRVFWPRPFEDPRSCALETAFKALVRGLGRNHAAIATMLYQFARQPERAATDDLAAPLPPNQAWIARVLNTDQSTVSRVKREIIARGLATEHASGLLVFVDPARWPAILNVVEPVVSEPVAWERAGERLTLVSLNEASGNTYTIADASSAAAANGSTYALADTSPAEVTSDNTDAIADVERALALAGWMLPPDPLAHEIIAKAVDTWGPIATIARLQTALAGPYPSYALEPLGAELGEEFECPYQLIRCG